MHLYMHRICPSPMTRDRFSCHNLLRGSIRRSPHGCRDALQQPANASGGLDLADLLGGGGDDVAPAHPAQAGADLLGGSGAAAPAPAHSQKPSVTSTDLDALFGGAPQPAGACGGGGGDK